MLKNRIKPVEEIVDIVRRGLSCSGSEFGNMNLEEGLSMYGSPHKIKSFLTRTNMDENEETDYSFVYMTANPKTQVSLPQTCVSERDFYCSLVRAFAHEIVGTNTQTIIAHEFYRWYHFEIPGFYYVLPIVMCDDLDKTLTITRSRSDVLERSARQFEKSWDGYRRLMKNLFSGLQHLPNIYAQIGDTRNISSVSDLIALSHYRTPHVT